MDQAEDQDRIDIDFDWSEFLSLDPIETFEPDIDLLNCGSISTLDHVPPDFDDIASLSMSYYNPATSLNLDQNQNSLPLSSIEKCLLSGYDLAEHAFELEYQHEEVSHTTDTGLIAQSGSENPPTILDAELKLALSAVQNDSKSRSSQPSGSISAFSKFRVDLPISRNGRRRSTEPKAKKLRLKRSVTRPCLLCRHLKLKCSPGRPCARCVERCMGQGDLDFTYCLRDHPSKFNPFNFAHRQVIGENQDCPATSMIFMIISIAASQHKPPPIFTWLFSYVCHSRVWTWCQLKKLPVGQNDRKFWLDNQYKLSQYAFKTLENTLASRDTRQHSITSYGQSLIIALCIYAWLGSVTQQTSTESEREKICKQYLSEYVDLLVPRCMPGLSNVTIRDLFWNMHNLTISPAAPWMKPQQNIARQMRHDTEQLIDAVWPALSQVISSFHPTRVDDCLREELFSSTYWPKWKHTFDRNNLSDAFDYRMDQTWSIFSGRTRKSMAWNLGCQDIKKNPVSKVEHEKGSKLDPILPGKAFLTKWMKDAQKKLVYATIGALTVEPPSPSDEAGSKDDYA